MMGGAYFEVGNITPAAEFNIYVDPEAADVVLHSGVPITMLPLDVTHKALSPRSASSGSAQIGTGRARRWRRCSPSPSASTSRNTARDGAPLHDPCVIA